MLACFGTAFNATPFSKNLPMNLQAVRQKAHETLSDLSPDPFQSTANLLPCPDFSLRHIPLRIDRRSWISLSSLTSDKFSWLAR